MGIEKKTKEERRSDVPLGETPDPTKPITDLRTALADINARSAARREAQIASRKKLDEDRIARSKQKKSIAGGEGSRLSGLATFASTTGKKTT